MFSIHQPQEIIHQKYRITGILDKGGVAITYSAVNLETDFSVAIKVISLKQLNDWKQIELFEREAEVLQKLNHPAIAQYIDYFDIETDTDKAFYLVQQLAPGKSLAQLVESGWRVSEEEVKNIAKQILSILSYLHSLEPPVIHRDIKPSNLIRDNDGKIYLVDFGAVQNTYYNTLTQGSTVVGTYGYMAPEQFRGQALPATDLYSLGATLLYLLTHRSPAELPQDTLKLDFRNSVDISESFADWLDKILEPDLEDRFSNAEVALTELFKSEKKKQRKLVKKIGAIALTLGLITGFNSYKWFFLSRLGYIPAGICSNVTTVENYLDRGGKANIKAYKFAYGTYPLLNCVIRLYNIEPHKKQQLVALLIKNGADVNQKDLFANTPLLISVKTSKPDINTIKLLLENGADPNLVNARNESPLLVINDIDIVKLLIKYEADVNAQDDNGSTPLFYAENAKIAQILIKNGADINIKNKFDKPLLFHAIYKKREAIVKLLIENGVDVNLQDKHGYTPLSGAVNLENLEIIKLLIKEGANVNFKDKYGQTLISQAIYKQQKEIVQLLLDYGADRSYLNPEKIKKGYRMNEQQYFEVINFLQENEFNTNKK